jgi:tripartite-type tricarboxylate transporter receptor subunit TctC
VAFDKLIQDPEFRADLKKVSLALDPLSGDEVEKLQVEAIGAATPDTLKLIKDAMGLR